MEAARTNHHAPSMTTALPAGQQSIASYMSYDSAQNAVDRLLEYGLPADRVPIVGHGLSFVEELTGRRGYFAAAVSGAVTGAGIGALFGFVAGIFNWIEPLVSALALGLYGLSWAPLSGSSSGCSLS